MIDLVVSGDSFLASLDFIHESEERSKKPRLVNTFMIADSKTPQRLNRALLNAILAEPPLHHQLTKNSALEKALMGEGFDELSRYEAFVLGLDSKPKTNANFQAFKNHVKGFLQAKLQPPFFPMAFSCKVFLSR